MSAAASTDSTVSANENARRKVFGVGMFKTGTTSLGRALEILGYRSRYRFWPLLSDRDAYFELDTRQWQPFEAQIREAADRFDAFADAPWLYLYRELDGWYPGSRFVLTLRRDAEAAVESDLEMWLRLRIGGIDRDPDRVASIRARMLERYRRHRQNVEAYFEDRPEDLLEVCWDTDPDPWRTLCDFLAEPVPDRPFPHLNRAPRGRSSSTSSDEPLPGATVVTPSGDRIPVPLTCGDLPALREHLGRELCMPAEALHLFEDERELITEEDLNEALAREPAVELDLAVVVGNRYVIHRPASDRRFDRLAPESLHPPRASAQGRSVEELTKIIPIRLSKPIGRQEGFEEARDNVKEWMRAWNQRRRHRQAVVESACHRLSGPLVVCSVVNEGFLPLARNWAASCDHHGIASREFTIFLAADEASHRALGDLGFEVVFDEESVAFVPQQASHYGRDGFVRSVLAQVAFTAEVLETGRDVLAQDVDLVWQRDPRDELIALASRRALDLAFMDDGPNPRFAPLHYNSGFILFRNSEITRAAWHCVVRASPAIAYLRSDQEVVNQVMGTLRRRGLLTGVLPPRRFVNGHWSTARHNPDGRLPEEARVVHFSWASGLDNKIERMRAFDQWYLD